jgi:hypothetical protein
MANEIRLTVSLTAAKGSVGITTGQIAKSIDMAGTDMLYATQHIGIAAETINFADITGQPGAVLLVNLDPTNFIEVAHEVGMTNKICKLLPGVPCFLPLPPATLYAKADTATCDLLVAAVEA